MNRIISLTGTFILCFFLSLTTISQGFSEDSEFLLVEPDYEMDCISCVNVSGKMFQELYVTNFFKDLIYPANINSTDFESYKSQHVNYVFQCKIKAVYGRDVFKITCTLDSIYQDSISSQKLHRIDWNNNEYLIDKNNLYRSVQDITDLILDDLRHFERHKVFKVRIKVDNFKEPVEDIDKEEFSTWMTQILNHHDTINKRYVFYYNNNKYPDDLEDKFYGKFKDSRPLGDDLLKVEISIVINDEHSYCKLVILHSEEYKREIEYQKKIIEAILKELDLN